MQYAFLDIEKMRDLEADIQQSIRNLRTFSEKSDEEFEADEVSFAAAEHHFRRALEGVLTIGTHILSRIPVRTKDYQDVIVQLGKHGVVPMDFSKKNKSLAGYRNRMVHLYWEVTPKELRAIIIEHLDDIDKFCEYYREVARHPEKFGLHIEE